MKRKIVCICSSAAVLIFSLLFSLSMSYAAGDYELYIARGIEKLNKGNYSEALDLLKRALELSPEDTEAAYYTAVAYSRLGEYEQAEELFLKILKKDEADVNVYLELGRLYNAKRECLKSRKYLSRFISLSNDEALKKYAKNLLEDCSRSALKKKSCYLNLTAGGQYDDNVIIEPQNPAVAADRKSDGRFVAYLTAGADLFEKGPVALKAEYNFYQSLHEHLSKFNLQYHKITPSLDIAFSDVFSTSVGYTLEYTLLGKEQYSRFHTYFGKIIVMESAGLSTEAIYEYKDHKYWDTDMFRSNSIRTGYRNTAGLRQNFGSGNLSGNIYFFSDFDKGQERYWDFNGYRSGAELTSIIAASLYINVSGEYTERRYLDDYPLYQKRRLDRMQQYTARLTYFFSDRISASITDTYSVNNSNLGIYDYTRNIAGIFLTAGLL